jgi:hypothetical protein
MNSIEGKQHNLSSSSKICRRLLALLITIVGIIFGAWLIHQSQALNTLDQGDYERAIAPLLIGPANNEEYRHWEKPTLEWHFRNPINLSAITNSSSAYFASQAFLQKIWRPSFSLPLLGTASKALALVAFAFLASALCRQFSWGIAWGFFIWIGLSCCFFMAHNIYLLNSFYQEHVFWLGLPILLYGLTDSSRWRSLLCIIFGATICGLSKTQFFYIPGLVLFARLLWDALITKSVNKGILISLLISQLVCALPLLGNPYRNLNYYHATYYGSYILTSPSVIDQLAVPKDTIRCIGSDRWGAVLTGIHGDQRGLSISPCFDNVSLSTTDVLAPYLKDPKLIWRMWHFAEAALWTAKPFHNIHEFPYIVTPEGLDPRGVAYPFPENNFSLALSEFRERHLTHRVGLMSLIGLALAFVLMYFHKLGKAPLLILFLLLLLWSQIVMALLGEGFRDLGKHFAAANLSYDLLLFITGTSFIALLIQWIKSRGKLS